MRPDLFTRIGVALYGQWWQADMAEALNVSTKSVQRYASGDRRVPVEIATNLSILLAGRIVELGHLGEEIDLG